MNELKKLYNDSKAKIIKKWVVLEVPRCYEVAEMCASMARPNASCVLHGDVPAYAWDAIVDSLRHECGITAVVQNDRDNGFTPTVVMSGWAN